MAATKAQNKVVPNRAKNCEGAEISSSPGRGRTALELSPKASKC